MNGRLTRKIFLSLALLLISAAVPLSAQPSDPLDFVKSLYAHGAKDSPGEAFWLNEEGRQKYFSKATAESWKKADARANPNGDEVGTIDFDLTTNTQGAEIKSYSIVSSRVSGGRATVVVKLVLDHWFRKNLKDNVIRYDLVREDGRWVIDDIASTVDGKPWTLKKLIAFQMTQ